MPKVSIIVPNYNHARFLRRRLESILYQTFEDFEVILLDDCSTDESRDILLEYSTDSRVRVDFNVLNSGSTFKQWNKGVRLARGEYVWIAESDDYADTRFLERILPCIDRDAVAFAYCRSWSVTDDNQTQGFADRYLTDLHPVRWAGDFVVDGFAECQNYFVHTNPVPNASAVVFRKAIYIAVGEADESFRICGDWKLWSAMALRGKISYIGEPLNYFRFHEASVRNQTLSARTDIAEHLAVVKWVTDMVKLDSSRLNQLRQEKAAFWVPAVMSLTVPLRLKWNIIRAARSLDPQLIRHSIRPALDTIHHKCLRYWRELQACV